MLTADILSSLQPQPQPQLQRAGKFLAAGQSPAQPTPAADARHVNRRRQTQQAGEQLALGAEQHCRLTPSSTPRAAQRQSKAGLCRLDWTRGAMLSRGTNREIYLTFS